MYHDEKAEQLEKKGLYRRAADRWLEKFMQCRNTGEQEWATQNRRRCLALAKRPLKRNENFSDVHKAAKATQDKMGISRQDGATFRTYKEK